MYVFEKKKDINSHIYSWLQDRKSIGFVPTMGALHNGHISLIKRALKENDLVIVSIFVNPTQFNNSEDLKKYPRTLTKDIELISELSNEIVVFTPDASEMYGETLIADTYDFGGLEFEMEGKYRTGHFDGVATILKHFFKILTPTRAYFGEKDFQQLQIVRKLVEQDQMSVIIVGCPIYREEDGLALSSRNIRLNATQRKEAPIIYKYLKEIKRDFGIKSVLDLKAWITEQFQNNEILTLEYFEIAKITNLKPIENQKIELNEVNNEEKYRAFIAVFAGEIRLIDNIALN